MSQNSFQVRRLDDGYVVDFMRLNEDESGIETVATYAEATADVAAIFGEWARSQGRIDEINKRLTSRIHIARDIRS